MFSDKMKVIYNSRISFYMLLLLLIFTACSDKQKTAPVVEHEEIQFSSSGTALLSIPSLNGNKIAIRIKKPEGDGPFPVLIGVAGGDSMYAFNSEFATSLHEMGIVTVDFAPQGRGDSEGQDNFHGTVHQDDLKAIVDFVSPLAFVQQDNIGILSYSYGVVLATGALARYPEMPIAFLIDWEGPSCPGRDVQRGLENNEPWVKNIVLLFSGKDELSPEEYSEFMLHGGSISDEAYWLERDAARFAKGLPCPYLRVQFYNDHAQGTYKYHMMEIINAATENSGEWTRCNDNPANIIYSEEELSKYYFHKYSDGEFPGSNSASKYVDEVLLTYVEEMFFSRPYDE
jgi:hypothetical protein